MAQYSAKCLTENIFKKASKKAKDFFKATKKNLKNIKKSIVRNKKQYTVKKTPKNFKPGSLITFKYDALDKTKQFDKNPLVLSLGLSRNNNKHFLGLNVHWMPESKRVLLASLIIEMLNKKKDLVYDDIKPLLKQFEGTPILRRYAIRRVSNKVIQMPQDMYMASASITYPEWHYGDADFR